MKRTPLHVSWEHWFRDYTSIPFVNKKMKRQWQEGFYALTVVAFELERFRHMRWRGVREINTSNLLYYTTLDTERRPHWIVDDSKCQLPMDLFPSVCCVTLVCCDIAKQSPNTTAVTWSFSLINISFCPITLKVKYHSEWHMDNPSCP